MNSRKPKNPSFLAAVAVAVVMAVAGPAGADSVKLTNGLTYEPVTVTDVSDGLVVFRMGGVRELTKPFRNVALVRIDGDEELTRGELLFYRGEYLQARIAYEAVRAKAYWRWKRRLIDYRLAAVAEALGNTDDAVGRWLKIVDSAKASRGALALRPVTLARTGSAANDRAIALLEAKAKDVKSREYVKAIDELLVDLYERQGRVARIEAMVAKIAGLTGAAPTARTRPAGPAGRKPSADSLKPELRLAEISLKAGRYKDAIKRIEPYLKRFTADELPPALLIMGRAGLEIGKAEPDQAAASEIMAKAGLDLMRVVVFFPSSAEAPRAFFLAGQVNERLGNVAAAKAAYSSLSKRFADSPAARDAGKALERIKNKRDR